MSVLHVSGNCDVPDADGTAERPFSTIRAAVERADVGAAVLIAPGAYTDELTLTKDISLIGSSDGTSYDGAGVVLEGGSTLTVTAGKVLLRGLQVVRANRIGIWSKGAELTVEGSQIRDSLQALEGDIPEYGYGVVVSDNGSIILQHNLVSGCGGVGVLMKTARGIILQNEIKQNGGGGIQLNESVVEDFRIEGNKLTDNVQLGIGVFSSRAIILQNEIAGTKTDAAEIGDGILVGRLGTDGGPSDVTIEENTIEGSGRTGILCDSVEARGIILQNNTINASGTGSVSSAAGVWLQAGAGGGEGSLIQDNRITGSKFVGVGLTGDTHGIILQHNTITQTVRASKFDGVVETKIGDGINLLNGASATMRDNIVTDNGRFGLIVDGADVAATTIAQNTFNNNVEYGIILQNQDTTLDITDNVTMGNLLGATLENPPTPFTTQSEDFPTLQVH